MNKCKGGNNDAVIAEPSAGNGQKQYRKHEDKQTKKGGMMMLLEPNQVQGTVKSNIVNMKININKQKREG